MLSVSIFNVARYLTDSLRVQCSKPYDERVARVWWDGRTDGRDGTDGTGRTDGHQKCPLIFFILRYIKHYTLKNTLLVGFFLNQSKSTKFYRDFFNVSIYEYNV